MAHHEEPMDIDRDFDNKENSLHHNNVLPFTEKGYEELDVSELNMKLRYSVTPVSSPMSKSYTANCLDNRSYDSGDESLNNTVNENANLTRSLNSTITKNDNVLKSLKTLPIQKVLTEQIFDSNRQSILRSIKSEITPDNGNIHVTITSPTDADENLSLPSSASSALQTPEATTPTKDIQHKDGGSPIMRGLKSVLNMFRSSQSPIPPADDENIVKSSTLISPENEDTLSMHDNKSEQVLASTPISAHRKKEMSPTKRYSPLKDNNSIVFNQDLERELQWKDETTIIFSQEKIPIHKLLLQQPQSNKNFNQGPVLPLDKNLSLNSTTDYMDISYNDSIKDSTMVDIQTDDKKGDGTLAGESDSEFVDCETTFTKSELPAVECNEMSSMVDNPDLDLTTDVQNENESGSRLRQIILNTTQDILDATLSVKPEDLLPEPVIQTLERSDLVLPTDIIESPKTISEISNDKGNTRSSITSEIGQEIINTTKTIEGKSNAELFQQTAVTTSSIENVESHLENLDVVNIDTTLLSEEPAVTGNLNTEVTNEIDKTCQEDMTSCGDNLTGNLANLDNNSVNCQNIDESASSRLIVSAEVNSTMLEDHHINVIPTVPLNELPIDVPLPDEDDIEKDYPIESTTFVKEDLDVGNAIQVTSEIVNNISTTNIDGVDGKEDLNQSDNISLSEKDQRTFDHKEINNQITELNTTLESQDHIKEIEVSEISDTSNFLSKKQLTQDVTSISTDPSISDLPDIVNQTITITNIENSVPVTFKTENLEPTMTNYEMIITSEAGCKLGDKDDLSRLQIVQEIQAQNEISESNKLITSNSIVEQPIKVTDEHPHDDCSYIMNDVTTAVENTTDTLKLCHIDTELTNILSTIENSTLDKESISIAKNVDKDVDVELVLSKNNSPFVSVTADTIVENVERNTEHPISVDVLTAKGKVLVTPPSSPPIRSKGYNFNFDDMDFDPFATKTNIRMSPPLASSSKPDAVKVDNKIENLSPKKDFNRRKSQPNKRRSMAPKRKLNSTFDGSGNEKTGKSFVNTETIPAAEIELDRPVTVALSPKNVMIEENDTKVVETNDTLQETIIVSNEVMETDSKIILEEKSEHVVDSANEISCSNENDLKGTSSSEQSTYFSAGTSSSDCSIPSRNVFNLPEIDDRNFNPFASKCKMRQSPPPNLDIDNKFNIIESTLDSSTVSVEQSKNKNTILEDKVETEVMEKDTSINLSDTTNSSKVTNEKNITTQEIHTEDEDTIEGPFLEADDMNLGDKMSELDSENIDMIQFSELPMRGNEENPCNDEMFIDAEAFEFLLNQNKSNTVVDSGKESLFLKFDPLFAKRMSAITSDSVVASLTKLQKRQSTPTKEIQSNLPNVAHPSANVSNVNVTQDIDFNIKEDFNDDPNFTVSKPMMVVPPAVNPVTPRNKSLTPNRSNRRSFTFTSPAMAVIDRLLSLSGNSPQVHDTTVTQVSREQNEADIALSQLRELLAEKEINVYNLRSESNELRDRLNTLESHVKNLEVINQDKLKKINQLNETLAEKTKVNKSMAAVVEEYERTIARLIAETAQDKNKHAEERIKLINERDEQTAHLASMEVSFSDLHSKYEKSKQVILHCKANEDVFKKSIKDFEENLAKMQNNYELLKQHATSKLNHANQELEKMNKSHEAEVLKLNAMIKRKDLHITSLEESLAQKTKANEELTAICDELINKVG